ncbi:MoaF-related domain-containing protein [Paenibacillus sp. Soil522]|uniref:MoaF-related domain-containing protein n=1 Tax=Paenibacillus sp. Soil522 TaxID=1736388 RepID=UPI0009D75AFA|nr:MoaF N-terminal domain-containing protein [Paenibacillus sp. Soil522]
MTFFKRFSLVIVTCFVLGAPILPFQSFAAQNTELLTQKVVISQSSNQKTFIGKSYRIIFEDGYVFNATYIDESHLHWEEIEGPFKGLAGDEKMTYRQLAPGLFFVNWLEETGVSVSQVLDLNKMIVHAFMTYEKNGKRQELFHSGTLTPL